MKLRHEAGVVVGNVENKYASTGLARLVMDRFLSAFDDLVGRTGVTTVFEVGCGEGELSLRMAGKGMAVRASDFSRQVIDEAKVAHEGSGIGFEAKSIYELEESDRAPLVVCCEVLEHLEHPELGLQKLHAVAESWVIVSVPREPLWCCLNLLRGKYIRSWGNTPGHIQHWSKRGFIDFVGRYFEIVEVKSPIPWTMCLCRKKQSKV